MTSQDDNENRDNDTKDEKTKGNESDDWKDAQAGNAYLDWLNDIPPDKQVSFGLDFFTDESVHRTPSELEEERRIGKKISQCVYAIVIIFVLGLATTLGIFLQVQTTDVINKKVQSCLDDGDYIVKVEMDHNKQTILLTAEDRKRFLQGKEADILFVYNKKMVAYLDHFGCYISRLDETFEEGKRRWTFHKNKGKRQKDKMVAIRRHSIQPIVLKTIVGMDIYLHCGKANPNVLWMMSAENSMVDGIRNL